jgi:hypothetical protein
LTSLGPVNHGAPGAAGGGEGPRKVSLGLKASARRASLTATPSSAGGDLSQATYGRLDSL